MTELVSPIKYGRRHKATICLPNFWQMYQRPQRPCIDIEICYRLFVVNIYNSLSLLL